MNKQSAQVKIIQVLKNHPWLSIEEIEKTYRDTFYGPIGVSNNNIGTRLPELAREGYTIENLRYYTIGRKRDGKAYCEWKIDRVEVVGPCAPLTIPQQIPAAAQSELFG